LDLRDLRYFLTVAELGNLHRAAEREGRSQPALTKSIQRLEGQVGSKLIFRDGRGIKLTTVGEALLGRAQAICYLVDESVEEIASIAKGNLGHVRVGTVPTGADSLLPAAFGLLASQSTKLTFQVTVDMTDLLRKLLRSGEIDLVIAPMSKSDELEFAHHSIASDYVVVASRKDHPLQSGNVELTDLLNYSWLLPSKVVSSRQWLEQRFLERDLPLPQISVEANTVSILRRGIALTDMLTFVSRQALQPRGEMPLHEIPLEETTMKRELGVLHRRGQPLSPAADKLISALVASAPHHSY
jgi:DNA-binding transcriptional LysR family regulator